ncbi:MAG: ATP-dependent 6-phosphofructokinase [Chloroflexi bacterium]|nr:ATP-dependent 6-phosphofructokinase [Chloroflexota bacterium]
MAEPAKRIGVLTSGGDCPGLNAVVRAVTKTAILNYGYQVIGFEDGYVGLVENKTVHLANHSVSGILAVGGTILGTSNKADPFRYWRTPPEGQRVQVDESKTVQDVYSKLGLEALVVIGGDGSLTIAHRLSQMGLNIVGIPKTIDNDVEGTDQSFGFDSAVGTITAAVDVLHTTAMSHHRAMVVEVMGRNAGWLALTAGVAGGGDIILIPEIEYNIGSVCHKVTQRSKHGKKFSIIVVAEGAKEKGSDVVVERILKDSPDPIRLGGIGRKVAEQIENLTGIEARVTVLGHLQRGGPPSPHDRVLGTLFGASAMELIAKKQFGRMVSLRAGGISSVDMAVPAGKQWKVPRDYPLIGVARGIGTSFGDSTC